MKALMVVDMPKNCMICQYRFREWYEEVGTIHICSMCNERLREEDFGDNRADFCPLKPMPEKSDYEPKDDYVYNKVEILAYTYGLTVGRNLVIDEILGEEE